MRVMCINNKPIPFHRNEPHLLAILKEGEPYTVTGRFVNIGGTHINLLEAPAPNWPEWGWGADRFIPLSDEPAEAEEAEYELETATI